MEIVEIKGSSYVAGAGFARGVIRVLFHSGRYADFHQRTRETFDALLAAPSKGRFVNEMFGRTSHSAPSFEGEKREVGPLETLTEEADKCCRRAFLKAMKTGAIGPQRTTAEWECPTCDQLYERKDAGPVRFWEAVIWGARF